jgi:GxxExxY protein
LGALHTWTPTARGLENKAEGKKTIVSLFLGGKTLDVPTFEPIPTETEHVATEIINAALQVHSTLGPGLLESIYEVCLCQELRQRSIPFRSQVAVPVLYREVRLEAGLRLDLVVADRVIVELKAVEKMSPLFEAQLLTYLKLSGLRLGFLINFNVPLIRDGIRRFVR